MSIAVQAQALKGTLRVLAALIGYPDERLRAELEAMREILRREDALAPRRHEEVESLIDELAAGDPLDVEAGYVQLFDCGRATSLHLFEHVHGDSRDRGPAMVDLARTYEQAGLHLAPGELPDYLPVVLEFASTQPPREAREFLGEIGHVLQSLHAALRRRGSAYACIPAALVELAGGEVRAVVPAEEAPLDEAWEEPPAFGGCSARGQARPGQPQPIQVVRRKAKPGVTA